MAVKLNKTDSHKLKFMAYDLYSLPLSLKPYESIDTTNTRYINQNHTLLINSLKTHLILISITKNGLINHF